MIVPVLLLSYATHFYVSVARLPRPETNLLLIAPVYWILLICCVIFAAFRFRDALRANRLDEPAVRGGGQKIDLWKSGAFLVLTGLCIWAIPTFGFISATLAYSSLLLLALGVRSISVLLITPVALVGVLWVGMEYYLNLRLPAGMLF